VAYFSSASALSYGTNSEHGGKGELELFNGHGLELHRKVEGRDRDLGDFLERVDERFLLDIAFVDTCARKDQVGRRLRYVIPHGESLGLRSDEYSVSVNQT